MITLAIVLTSLVVLGMVPFVSRGRRVCAGARAGVALILLAVLVLFLNGWL